MLAFQAALHLLFGAAQGAPLDAHLLAAPQWLTGLLHGSRSGDAGAMWAQMRQMQMTMPPGMSMPSMPGMPGSVQSSGGAMAGMGHGPWAMLAAHAGAGLVCSWWLERGEALLFGLVWALIVCVLAPIRLAVSRGSNVPPLLRQPRIAAVGATRRRLAAELLTDVVVRRGPPASVNAL